MATLNTKGQIVIPCTICDALELRPGDDFEEIRRKDKYFMHRIGARPRPRRELSEHSGALRGIETPNWDKPVGFPMLT